MADVGRRAVRESRLSARRDRRIRRRKLFPVNNASRHLQMYDPQTKKLTHIGTCFATHHLMFAEDANRTLWTSGGGQVIGWLNTKMFDETGDEVASQGWTPLIVDTNGNGKRDAWTEPDQPVDPTKDGASTRRSTPRRLRRMDRSGDRRSGFPGAIMRLIPGTESVGDRADGNLRAAGVDRSEGRRARVLAARRWTSIATACMWSRSVERTHGELRSPQVQGSAERSEGDGTALPRRMDVLSGAAAADSRA